MNLWHRGSVENPQNGNLFSSFSAHLGSRDFVLNCVAYGLYNYKGFDRPVEMQKMKINSV